MSAHQLQLNVLLWSFFTALAILLFHICAKAVRASVGGNEEKLCELWLEYDLNLFAIIWVKLIRNRNQDGIEPSQDFHKLRAQSARLGILTFVVFAAAVIQSLVIPLPPAGKGWNEYGVILVISFSLIACHLQYEVVIGTWFERRTQRGKWRWALMIFIWLFAGIIVLPITISQWWPVYGHYLNPFIQMSATQYGHEGVNLFSYLLNKIQGDPFEFGRGLMLLICFGVLCYLWVFRFKDARKLKVDSLIVFTTFAVALVLLHFSHHHYF